MRKILAVIVAFAMMALGIVFTGSQSAFAAGVSCRDGIIANTTVSSVSVPSGGGCLLYNVHVRGGVIVGQDAQFIACDSGIDGGLTANGAFVNVDPLSVIGGSVSINKPTLPEDEGEFDFCESEELPPAPFSLVLCAWRIGGSVTVTNAPYEEAIVEIGGCSEIFNTANAPTVVHSPDFPTFQPYINGPVLVSGNHQPVGIFDELIHGALTCTNNHPTAVWQDVYATNGIHGCVQD
jgi:hypothetical protein